MERQTPQSLLRIHSEIYLANKASEADFLVRQELKRSGDALFQKAKGVLHEFGEERKKNVGRGAGDGIIGYRGGVESYLETPPVDIELGGDKSKLTLTEDFTSSSGYVVRKDKIVLNLAYDTGSDREEQRQGTRQLFSVDRSGNATNWLGQEATIEQIEMASEVVDFLQDSLSDNHTPRSKQPVGEKLGHFIESFGKIIALP